MPRTSSYFSLPTSHFLLLPSPFLLLLDADCLSHYITACTLGTSAAWCACMPSPLYLPCCHVSTPSLPCVGSASGTVWDWMTCVLTACPCAWCPHHTVASRALCIYRRVLGLRGLQTSCCAKHRAVTEAAKSECEMNEEKTVHQLRLPSPVVRVRSTGPDCWRGACHHATRSAWSAARRTKKLAQVEIRFSEHRTEGFYSA